MENALWIITICFVAIFFIFAFMGGLVFCDAENSYGKVKAELTKVVHMLLTISIVSGLLAIIIFCFVVQYHI